MSYTGVKIPAALAKDDDERFYERMYLLEELETMVTGLFGHFVKIRVSPQWNDETLPKIREWIASIAPPKSDDAGDLASASPRVAIDPTATPRNEDVPPWEDPMERKN